ncbi:hypothetical protein WJX81_007181 [Elliptochloris bilobata]|uniref:Tr-type G domain-containing protein n=1 Tax=Elliptochloris bilobata TaxID=381761 RepID=A0AAW1SDH9_9CHLO
MDDWEDRADGQAGASSSQQQRPGMLRLNPSAPTFSFNPGASTFAPSWAPPPTNSGAAPAAAAPEPSYGQPAEPARPAAFVLSDEERRSLQAAAASSSNTEVEKATAAMADVHMADAAPARVKPLAEAASAPAQSAPAAAKGPPTAAAAPPASSGAAPAPMDEDEEDDEADHAAREAELRRINEELSKADDREHLNIVFIGHVDAGKSTTGGQILYLTGGVDERTIQKYEKEAKDKNRESWYMAYIMDTNEEERAKGKTVEVGRAHFATDKKRYTILDAPGHKNYVPNMIAGAAQADVGVLVIAARKGEFETGFERGGQTREHAQLARTLGVAKLIVAVNKMDDPSIIQEGGKWSQERYNEIVAGLTPFLKSCGYNPKKDIIFLPMSGLLGHNLSDPVPKNICCWWKGGTLFSELDGIQPLERDPLAPFRMSVIDKYKDMGTIVMGKSEAGIVRKGDRLYVMPNKVPVTVSAVYRDDVEVAAARGGENLRLRLAGVDEDEVAGGFVLCSRSKPVPCVTYFDTQLQILDLLEHKAIFTAGYKAVLHIHSLVEECEITKLLVQIDPKTRERNKAKFVKSGAVVIARIAVEKPICVEQFDVVPQLGRFTLRDEGRTIAIGKVIKLPKTLKAGD